MWEYDADEPFPSAMRTDLKRDLNSHVRRAKNTTTSSNNVPLFEKYNFLSPGMSCTALGPLKKLTSIGLFMGIFVMIILFSILYVGVNAVASLQVSYFSFSKEMNPANQKKQQ